MTFPPVCWQGSELLGAHKYTSKLGTVSTPDNREDASKVLGSRHPGSVPTAGPRDWRAQKSGRGGEGTLGAVVCAMAGESRQPVQGWAFILQTSDQGALGLGTVVDTVEQWGFCCVSGVTIEDVISYGC